MILTVLNPLVVAIVDRFKEVNDIEDPQVRLHTWATRADGIMKQHVPPELWKE